MRAARHGIVRTARHGVKPTRIRTLQDAPVSVRSRGLTNSSIPKLIRASDMPSSAMQSPAGTNHHHAPWASAWLDCAQNRTVPQFQLEMSATPMKARVISDRIAKMTVPTKPDAMTAVRFGRTSKRMIRQVDSPVARAAST